MNGVADGYGREESGTESDDAFSDWDSCAELMQVYLHVHVPSMKRQKNRLVFR